MSAPVEPQIAYGQYAWAILVAILGAVARIGRWTDDTGKFKLSMLVQELAGAVVFGQAALSVCAYMNWKPIIAGGISGVAGLLGAAAFSSIVQSVISFRLGGKKDASGKASGV